jgi:UDP-glucose 4-epimerase
MRTVVTGGAGYIGSVVAALLLDRGHEVVVLDDLSTGHADAVPPGAQFIQASLFDLTPDTLADAGSVIHLAARSLVSESMRDPSSYWHNNVGGTLALLDAMRAAEVPRLVFSSSAATYGDLGTGMIDQLIDEDAPPRPTSTYGATKLATDLALADHARAYGLATSSLRYFNVAGALITDELRLGERHRTETHLIPLALRAAVGHGPPLALYGTDYPTPDGTCVRDYIHVVDLAEAHLSALEFGAPGEHHVINLGSGTGNSVREVLSTIEAVTGRAVPVSEQPRRPGDPARLVASIDRARTLLGWRPQRDLAAMISDAVPFVGAST